MATRAAETSPTSSPGGSADSPSSGAASSQRTNGRPINSSGAGADPASNVTLRALVSTKEAGIIIGKAGKAVADLRETTGTKAGVSKVVPGVHDRVLSVSGGLEGVSKAYSMVAESILQNSVVAPDTSLTLPSSGTTIRLLVAHNLMGSIIGKLGSKIKEIQDTSGVRMVASKEMLPQSTERIVEVQGTPAAIKAAVYEISKCLMADWERSHGTVLYQAGALGPDGVTAAYPGSVLQGGFGTGGSFGAGNRRSGSGAPGGGAGFRVDRESSYRRREGMGENGVGGGGRPRNGSTGESPAPATAGDNLRTQNISIPSDMVGCIIGKGGTKINEIRRLSGSRISIAKVPHDETGERMFTITGTPEANEKALFLLYNQLESEKERRVNSADNDDQ